MKHILIFSLLLQFNSLLLAENINDKANRIAQQTIIIDTHIDVPYRLQDEYEDVSQATSKGDFDYPRAVKGGLNAPFMSIYIPAKLQTEGGSKALADKLIDDMEKLAKSAPKKFAIAHSTTDVKNHFKQGIISLALGMENGSPIEGKLENLKHFYNRGIRYITLTHSKSNHICDSSYDENKQWHGLSEFGKKLIPAMNKLGIMIDISHVSDETFYQVVKLSKVPVIASHSSARHFTPGFERNMSDDMIKKLAENGGVIQINFGSSFISEQSRQSREKFKQARQEFADNNKLELDNEKVKQFSESYQKQNPYRYATTDEVLDHFDHIVKLVGIDHVGIGSDYDGVGDTLPTGLKDVSTYPHLIKGLLSRGYSEKDIKKILSGNLLRVWQAVKAFAEKP